MAGALSSRQAVPGIALFRGGILAREFQTAGIALADFGHMFVIETDALGPRFGGTTRPG